MEFVKKSNLKNYIRHDFLPYELGGNSKFCYDIWLNKLAVNCFTYDLHKGFHCVRTSDLKVEQSTGHTDLNLQQLRERYEENDRLGEEYRKICKQSRFTEDEREVVFKSSL